MPSNEIAAMQMDRSNLTLVAITLATMFGLGCASAAVRLGVPVDRGYGPVDVPLCVTRIVDEGGAKRTTIVLDRHESLSVCAGSVELDVTLCERMMPVGHTFTLKFRAQSGADYEVAATCANASMGGPEGSADLCEVIVRDTATSKILDEASLVQPK